MLALLAGMAVFQAVASHPLGEDEAVTEGRVLAPHQSPALPTYHVGMLYPAEQVAVSSEAEQARAHSQEQQGRGLESLTATYPLREHDPLYAYVYDPGWTLPKPAPSPSAPVQAAQGALSEGDFDSYLLSAGVPLEWWADFKAIAHCESRWRPEAIGDGGNSIGLMQMWYGWASKAGVTDLLDPVQNLIAAKYVREVRGRYGGGGGWTCADKVGIY